MRKVVEAELDVDKEDAVTSIRTVSSSSKEGMPIKVDVVGSKYNQFGSVCVPAS